MNDNETFAIAFEALDAADRTVAELHAGCCQPLRSPRMETLAATLSQARVQLQTVGDDPVAAQGVIDTLLEAGSQLGSLQVECCAPDRMVLYADTLQNLSKSQRIIKRVFKLEH